MAYYDYDEDRALIKGAFCATFGMSPQDFEELEYVDYIDLFPSIDGETNFAHKLFVRMETDRSKIKDFSKSEYAEWAKWQKRKKEFEERQSRRNAKEIEKQAKIKKEKLKTAQERLNELLAR